MKKKYTIGEVSKILDVKPYVIRYWEDEIPFIAPRKNISGRRVYAERDVQILLRLKHLLYDSKYTIEGAQKRIWTELSSSKADAKSKIAELRSDLLDIWSKIHRPKDET